MSNRRAEMRRQNRANEKVTKLINRPSGNVIIPADAVKTMNAIQVSQATGVKIQLIKAWCDENVHAIWKDCIEQTNDILYRAECYMAQANVIMMLYAVALTFGDLKTVQKGMNRLVKNLFPAQQYVDKVGIKTAFEELQAEYGVYDLEYEDFDINELWDYKEKEITTFCKLMGGGYEKN